MRSTLYLPGLLLLCLLALSGCRSYPQSQTQLLPASQENQTGITNGDTSYTLEKIYTQEFTSYFTYGCWRRQTPCPPEATGETRKPP